MKCVTPKADRKEVAQMYGDMLGVSVELNLVRGQKWTATATAGYWWLRRSGSNARIRLTDAALKRLFVEVNDNV